MNEREPGTGQAVPDPGEEVGRDERLHRLYAAAYPSLDPWVEPSEALQRRIAERIAAEGATNAPSWLDRLLFRNEAARELFRAQWQQLRPVVFTMAVAFLVTWLPLRLAETGRLTPAPARVPRTATAPAAPGVPPQPEWLAGAARLASLLQGERGVEERQHLTNPSPRPPKKERPKERSAVSRPMRRLG